MALKRLDALDVATTDSGGAAGIYQRNFGFKLTRRAPDTAVLAIGGAEIHLKSGAEVAAPLASSGEGMAALWLEADDVDQVAHRLSDAGYKFEPIKVSEGRRILAIDPSSASQVPLFIFDRKS